MTRAYMAGCGGMLGRAFYEEFLGCAELRCTDIDVNEEWLAYLDLRELADPKFALRDPDVMRPSREALSYVRGDYSGYVAW